MNWGITKITRRCAALLVACAVAQSAARAELMITEFMAANARSLADEDGTFSDWVEIHNPDGAPADLTGWFLTDAANNRTKWQFPGVTIVPGEYLVVFASNKDRRDAAAALHTNFALSAGGEYLGLIRPDGTAASEFAPAYPAQTDDVSYGRIAGGEGAGTLGYFRTPTPGAANGGLEALQLTETVTFSRRPGVFTGVVSVELTGAAAGQVIRCVLITGTGSATAEPTAESAAYSGPIVLTSTTTIRAAVFSADGAVRGPVTTAHYLKLDPGLAGFASRLPVVVLDDFGAGALERDGVDHPSWMFGFRPSATQPTTLMGTAEVSSPLVTTVRGMSSADFPKKGYNLKLRDERGGKRAAPLFDLPAYERWALVAPWSFDPNFINNVFVYELSNRIGRWAPRTRLAEVFFNQGADALDASDYAGIYVITDRIRLERGRVDLTELSANDNASPAVTGGYLIKIDAQDEDEIGWRTERGVPEAEDTAIVLVAPEASDITPAQLGYIQDYVQRMEHALHADRAANWAQRTYLDYIDRASWIDHHLLNVLVNNPDALHRSAYFHKNRGGKLAAGPVWDFDRALGAYWDERVLTIDTWSGEGPTVVDVWRTGWWGILAEDPEFMQEWVDRWQSLRATQFSNRSLQTLWQNLADSVGTDAAARDVARWPESASPQGDYEAQIAHVKDWVVLRAEWIDAQFVARPTVATEGGSITFTAADGAILAYTLDGTDPRALGGDMAVNALTTEEPLTVPAGSNVHVRSFVRARATGRATSPWSAVAGGPQSSALAPAARFANLSVRGRVHEDGPVVAGFGIADTESKGFLVRAVGPGLGAFDATNFAPEPQLRLSDANGIELQRNFGWQTHPDPGALMEAAKATGAFPLVEEKKDAALLANVRAGRYQAEVAAGGGHAGDVLLEFYPTDTNGRTISLGTRGVVRPGEPLISGFVVQGPARKRVLIRAVGPGLGEQGVTDVLSDPEVSLAAGSRIIETNDQWWDSPAAGTIEEAAKRVGAFALGRDSADAALFVTLAPGAYTVEVKAKLDTGGLVLLEIFEVP